MDFIIGGAYQGKLDVARRKFKISVSDIFICGECDIDFSKKCIYGVDKFSLYCVKNGIEAKEYFELHKAEWQDSVIICDDIFCGVVPIDSTLRSWREMTGRLCTYLTENARTVTRVFCGLEQQLK